MNVDRHIDSSSLTISASDLRDTVGVRGHILLNIGIIALAIVASPEDVSLLQPLSQVLMLNQQAKRHIERPLFCLLAFFASISACNFALRLSRYPFP